jgi:Asp-tRNA(Asn)/Glu-tRNA(Gln) amidotransferase A subunit family amidase
MAGRVSGGQAMREPSAVEWLERLDGLDISARELATHYLGRIDGVNGPINATVAVEPTALLEQADAADNARSRGARLPLLGLPLTIKDSLATVGLPISGGILRVKGSRRRRTRPLSRGCGQPERSCSRRRMCPSTAGRSSAETSSTVRP